MTYVLALQQLDRTAIIADTRITWDGLSGHDGANTALKTGILFPGCTFAYVGDVREARTFLVQFKETVTFGATALPEIWARFQRYASSYRYPSPDHAFSIVLSSRSEGSPRLFIVDSHEGFRVLQSTKDFSFFTFGSGKPLLDPLVGRVFSERISFVHSFMMDAGKFSEDKSRRILPFHLCLWLNELSLTIEASMLEKYDVGGVFHFVSQTSQEESSQPPALYLMADVDEKSKTIKSSLYRVAGVEGGLMIDLQGPEYGRRVVLFDRANRLDLELYSKEQLVRDVDERLRQLPFYAFFGVGSTRIEKRIAAAFTYSENGQKTDIFQEDGEFRPETKQFVEYGTVGFPDDLDWKPSGSDH